MYPGMWWQYLDYSKIAVGYTWNVAGIFVQGHMPVIWNVCMPVDMVTLIIALSSCQVDVLT